MNANDSHWLTHPDELLEGYSPLHGLERVPTSLRTRQNVRVAAGLAAAGDLTVDAAVDAILDNAGLSAELLLELGPAAVAAHVRALADRIVAWAGARADMRLVTPSDPARRAGVVSIVPRDPAAASARLRAAGVTHAVREGTVRLSPHGYNTADEIDRALAALGG